MGPEGTPMVSPRNPASARSRGLRRDRSRVRERREITHDFAAGRKPDGRASRQRQSIPDL